MRKLYTLVTLLLFGMVAMKTTGQPITGFKKSFSVNVFSNTGIPSVENFSTEDFSSSDTGTEFNDQTNETCRANFEVNETPNSPLYKKFTAIPWHSEQKKPVYICWKFGDGTDTCIQYSNTYTGPYSVVHKYQQPGRYEVCVRIVYQDGCEAKECKWVEVSRPDECKADFEKLELTSTISPNYITYKALPSHSNNKKPKTICWKFGDGKDTCIQYPENFEGPYTVKHHYRENGLYEVCVVISYYGGCTATKCERVQIGRRDECKVDFERYPLIATNYPLDVYYKAETGHSNNKKPKQICWKFGDGKDTCIQYPENYTGPYTVKHQYREAGKYEVCVKVLFYGGCEAYQCKEVQIGRPDECKADFERIPISSSDNPSVVGFKALTSHSNGKVPKIICWSFGDGKDTCVEYTQNFSGPYLVRHKYENPGTYKVCVKIIYYGGCEAKKCNSIIVPGPDRCKVDFERLPLVNTISPHTAYYKLEAAHSNNKKPKTICWKFGDGKDTCIQYPENYTGSYIVKHQYREAGKYEVCAKVIFYGGCEAYQCKPIQIGRRDECKADFERIPVSSTDHPNKVAFKALPSHNNNKKPKTICWSFGDGKDTCIQYPENYTGPYVVKHEYREPGNYQVCIKIFYYGGCEAKKCEIIKIEDRGECKVKLFEITPSFNSLVRGFYASPWTNNNKKPVRICWYFGDGTDTCIQITPGAAGTIWPGLFIRHTYPAPGAYKACVKILFEGGCVAYDCEEVIIKPTTNTCGGYMTDSMVSPKTFKFKGFAVHNPTDPVIGYRWSFGDGSGASGREATHTYNQPGSYEVCLTTKTQGGCETKICKKLNVQGNTDPVLHISPNPVTNVMNLKFYSTQTEPVHIRIVNGFGVIVRTYTRNASTGANNWSFDLSTLTAGSYTLYVQSPNQLSSQIFIKN